MNNSCIQCIMDCDQYTQNERCENFKKARPISEYNRIIKEENRNLHKFCDKNNLKHSELIKMLKYKIRFKYKYRVLLESFLYEKDIWLEWIEEGEKTYGE
jgi:predicted transcriptional regulator